MNWTASGLISGILISSLGAGIFLYGKATAKLLPLIAGIVMSVYPFFVYSVPVMWVLTVGICVLLYVFRERQ